MKIALWAAATSGDVDRVQELLSQGVDAEAQNWEEYEFGQTALHYAATNGHVDVVEALLAHRVNVHVVDSYGLTALHSATSRGHIKVVKVLMEAGVDLNAVTKEGRTAVQYAAEHGDVDVLHLLMENGGDIHAADSSYGWTPLYYAVWEGHLEVAQALIKAGADVTIAVADGTTLLHGAARTGNAALVKIVVEAGVNVNAVTLDGRTALHYAGTEHINLEVAEALLAAGLDATALSYEGCTVLHYAAYFCDLDVLQRLAQAGADMFAVDNNGNNVLHNAACGPHVEVVEALIAAGVDTRAVNERGWTPFYCAVTSGSGQAMDAFFKNGLDVNEPLEGGCTILHQAIWSSATVEAVETLLKRGANVNAPDQDGKTALHHSPACYDPEISKVLLKGGADVKAVCNAGKTPLHYAALWNARVVTLLIEFGADLDAADNEGKTAVHVATEGVRIDALKLLIDAGADIHAVDKLGWTALHHAAHYARSELVGLLLESGANLFAKADAGQTPLAACLQWPADIYSLVWVVEVAYILMSNGATYEASPLDFPPLGEHKDTRDSIPICIRHWREEQRHGKWPLTRIPSEIVGRGANAVTTYLREVSASSENDLVLRRKVCVVGASKAGKTSLIKSITSMSPTLVDEQDRTIGVDLFHLAFTEEKDAAIRKHVITFWDFAGQDEYHVAHSLFFSRRTLYLLCVDIAAFSEVVKCSRKCDDEDEAEAAIDIFVREHVWRWFRMIFTRQPDAEFVVISTKADAIENESAVQLSELESELFKVLQEYKTAFQNEMQREMDVLHDQGGNDTKDEVAMDRVAQLQSLLTQLDQSLPSSWTPLNVCDRSSIEHACLSIQNVVIESGRSFLMPIKYSRVLDSIKEMRKEKPKQFIKDRIKQAFVPLPQLQQALVQTVEGLTPDECESILETLHDLGDVLWFARDGLAVLGDTLILSADLLIDLIRQIVCHDPAKIPSSTSSLDNQLLEEMQQSGKVAHDLLRSFSLWKRLDYPDQMLRIKQLLQHFRLAFPAGNCEMQADSDLIVPAYWRVRQHHLELSLLEPLTNKLNGREASMLTYFHWEYDFHHELVETAFEQLAVESYAVFDEREIHGHCIESIPNDDFAIRIALGTRGRDNQRRQVILLEVVAVDCDLAADFLQLLYEATENVLGAFPGLYASCSAVVNGHRNRIDEAVQKLRAATPSMLNVLKRRYSWLPLNVVSWYHLCGNPKTACARPATNVELTKIASMYNRQKSMTVKMEKMLTKMDNTKETMVNLHAGAGNHRDLPALWVVERVLKPKSKLILWILSEISGRCFHQPIEIEVSSKFLATHGELLQTGLSLFANALPDDIPIMLPLVKELAAGAVSAFGASVERAGRVHSMIDQLDLTEGGITRSNESRTLPPAESYNLLQRILKEHDESFATPSVSTITKLECATLDDGRYQWAHREEHTGCQNRLRIDYASTSAAADPMSTSSETTSVSNGESPKYHMCDFVVDAQSGGKDWRRAYCVWEIVDSQQSLALESGQTIQNPHEDLQQQSLWLQSFVLTKVTSVRQLKECELLVTLKRPSRLALRSDRVLGSGSVRLRDFLAPDAEHNFACDRLIIPMTEQKVQVYCKLCAFGG